MVPFDGVFAPLSDPKYFRKLSVYGEGGGTIHWLNGADIDPAVLYAEVSKEPIRWAGRAVYSRLGPWSNRARLYARREGKSGRIERPLLDLLMPPRGVRR